MIEIIGDEHAEDWTEKFREGEWIGGRSEPYHSRREPVAAAKACVVRKFTTEDCGRGILRECGLDALAGLRRNQRTNRAARIVDRPKKQTRSCGGEPLQERRFDRAINNHPTGGRALLASVPHRSGSSQCGGTIEISITRNDHDIFAAHFGLCPNIPLRGDAGHPRTNSLGASERHRANLRVRNERHAGSAIAVHDIEHAIGELCGQGGFGDQVRSARCVFRGLEHHGVSEGECWCRFPEWNRQWKVPRRNERYRSQWITQRELQCISGLRRNHLTNLANGFTGVIAADHGGPGDFAARFTDRLADFPRHHLREFFAARSDRVAPPVERLSTRRSRLVAPGSECIRGSRDRHVNIGGRTNRGERNHVRGIGWVQSRPSASGLRRVKGSPDEVWQQVIRHESRISD